jgi:hypothetical protein
MGKHKAIEMIIDWVKRKKRGEIDLFYFEENTDVVAW